MLAVHHLEYREFAGCRVHEPEHKGSAEYGKEEIAENASGRCFNTKKRILSYNPCATRKATEKKNEIESKWNPE